VLRGHVGDAPSPRGVELPWERLVEYATITVTAIAPGYIDTPMNRDVKSRPFLIDVGEGARIMADLIERGAGSATVPRLPWILITPLLRVLPASWLTRAAPQRDAATGP
jgi:NAD(P)-dependent dehydrogenase (short-subunit alcohol dehydrogenase family)